MMTSAARIFGDDVTFGADDMAVDHAVDSFDDAVSDRAVGVFSGVAEDVEFGNAADGRREVPASGHVEVGEVLDARRPVVETLSQFGINWFVPAPIASHRRLDQMSASDDKGREPAFDVENPRCDLDEMAWCRGDGEVEFVDSDSQSVRHQIPTKAEKLCEMLSLQHRRFADEGGVGELPFRQLEAAKGHGGVHVLAEYLKF